MGEKPKVIVYSTPTCPWCHLAKEFLTEQKISFEDKDVSTDGAAKAEMMKKSGQMGVPVLEIGKKVIVGFDSDAILKALNKTLKK